MYWALSTNLVKLTPQWWKLKKADLELFSDLCSPELATDKFSDCINPIESFSSSLINV
jgi:hypothetical protein